MSTASPLDIKVVYSSSSRGRRRRRVPRVGGTTRRPSLVLLGVLNLTAAAGLYYATWWHVDRFLYITLVLRTPVSGVDASSGILVPALPDAPGAQPPAVVARRPAAATDALGARHRFEGQTAQVVMGVTAYSWLGLATIAFCALALSAGAALGGGGGAAWRRAGLILAPVGLLGMGWAAYYVWSKYGLQYPPNHFRLGMGGLLLLAALIGLAVGRGVRGVTRLAAITLVLSAVGSAIGLYLGALCGAIPPEQSSVRYLAIAFAIHSFWGWLLLPLASRINHR